VIASGRHPRLRHAGDTLLLVEFEAVIDAAVSRRVIALARAIAGARLRGILDVVPAYASVGIHYDPLRFDPAALDAVLASAVIEVSAGDETPGRVIEIPVRYGAADGPDLAEVARFAGCTTDEVIARHTAGLYRVYMLGFLPGFAYLGVVDSSIAMPRRDSPRTQVPAGSVGIAGSQTGVYPCESPGGWRLVGRTATRMFDPDRSTPALLAPGDQVRFVAITGGGPSEQGAA
jgi:inhibitor of KinA